MITAASYQSSEQLSADTYGVVLRLTDDAVGTYDRHFVVHGTTVAQLRDDATNQIVALNATLAEKNALAGIAPGTAIPLTLIAPVQTAQQKFFADLAQWARVNNAIAAGIVDPAAAEVVALKNQVKSEYQSAYLASF